MAAGLWDAASAQILELRGSLCPRLGHPHLLGKTEVIQEAEVGAPQVGTAEAGQCLPNQVDVMIHRHRPGGPTGRRQVCHLPA